MFWTTYRAFKPDDGGHFYIADYGIRIQGVTNSVIVWQPNHWHGTTLSAKGPDNQDLEYRQSGLSIVTPNRLPGIWKKYVANEMTAMQAEEELENSEEETEGYFFVVTQVWFDRCSGLSPDQ